MPRAAARTLSTSSSGLVSGEAAMNATIGADGVRVASMPGTIAVVPHEQNGVSVREHDRGADGCPAPLRQPADEPVGSQVHPNRGRRPARASRRRPSDRRPRACAALAASLAPTPARGWLPRAEPILLGRQELRFHDHLELHVRGERPRRWLRGQSMRQAHVTGVERCRLGRVPAKTVEPDAPRTPSKQRHVHASGEGIRAAAVAGERRRHAARAPRLGRGGWARSGQPAHGAVRPVESCGPSGSTGRHR